MADVYGRLAKWNAVRLWERKRLFAAQIMKARHGKAGSNLNQLDIANNWFTRIVSNLHKLAVQAAVEQGIEVQFKSSLILFIQYHNAYALTSYRYLGDLLLLL